MLKPLDIVVALKAHLWSEPGPWSFERLAAGIGVSASQAHASLRRMEAANLYRRTDRSLRARAFSDFAAHGIPFVFPAEPGDPAIGMPTGHAAPPLSDVLVSAEPYVWPQAVGVPGRALIPLHPAAPFAAVRDPQLYRALALLDALRAGRARERRLAVELLNALLAAPDHDARWLARQRDARLAR